MHAVAERKRFRIVNGRVLQSGLERFEWKVVWNVGGSRDLSEGDAVIGADNQKASRTARHGPSLRADALRSDAPF